MYIRKWASECVFAIGQAMVIPVTGFPSDVEKTHSKFGKFEALGPVELLRVAMVLVCHTY